MLSIPRAAVGVFIAMCAALLVGSCSTKPTSPRPSTIVVSPASVTLMQGDSVRLDPSVLDEQGRLLTGVPVTFSSDDDAIVRVSAIGLVASVGAAGSTVVRVTTETGLPRVEADVPVTVTPVADSLVVTPQQFDLPQNMTQQLTVVVLDLFDQPVPGATVTFTTQTPAIVAVSPTGLVSTVGPAGNGTIIVSSGTLSELVSVVVTQVATTITVSPNPVSLGQGSSVQLQTAVLDAVGNAISGAVPTFVVNPPTLVSVSPSGLVQSLGPAGSATITVSSAGLSTDVPVTVNQVGMGTARATLTGNPFGVAISAGGAVYATQLDGSVSRADIPGFDFTTTIPGGGQPNGVTFNAAGTLAYVAGLGGNTIIEIDVATNTPVATIPGINGIPFDVLLSPDEQTLYVGTVASRVDVVDVASRTVVSSITLVAFANHLARHPTQPLLYAAMPDASAVAEIDMTTNTLSRTITVGGKPQALQLSPDGSLLYFADEERGGVRVWDLNAGVEVGAVNASPGFGLRMTPDGTRLFLSSFAAGRVYEIDRVGLVVILQYEVGGGPRRVAISPDGTTVAIANQAGWVDYIQ